MTDTMLYTGIGILFVVGLTVQFLFLWHRHHRDYREHLEPILASHALQFVYARWPGFFKVGPFSKFEFEVGRPQSRVAGIRGEYSEYRIVTFLDSEGRTHEVWAQLAFEMFRFCEVKWRAESKSDLPEGAKALLFDQP